MLFSNLKKSQNLTVKTADVKVHFYQVCNCNIKMEYANLFSVNDLSISRKNGK